MKKLKILFTSSPDYSGNCRALYEFMIREHSSEYDYYWAISDNFDQTKYKNINTTWVTTEKIHQQNSVDGFDVIFSTHGQFIDYKTNDQLYISLWHGEGVKKTGYLKGNENLSEKDLLFCDNISNKCDYFLATSSFWQIIYSSSFQIKPERILINGLPRNDFLLKSPYKHQITKLLNIDIKSYKKIIIYLPTFDEKMEINKLEENYFRLKDYNEKTLIDFLEQNNYLLLIKYHPLDAVMNHEISSKNIKIINNNVMSKLGLELNSLLSITDILISDYSSVHVDYALLNKPLIFTHANVDEYSKKRGLIFNDRNICFPGPKVNTINELKLEIEKSLNDKNYFQKERNAFLDLMHSNKKIEGSFTLYKYLFKNGKLNDQIIKYQSEKLKLETKLNECREKNKSNIEKNNILSVENKELKNLNTKINNELDLIKNTKTYKIMKKIFKNRKNK